MTMLARLELWKKQGLISPEQEVQFAGLVREEPFSLSLELNILLYGGVLAFVAGLGWTISTWAHQLGDLLILTVISIFLVASFWYCFTRAKAWSPTQTAASCLNCYPPAIIRLAPKLQGCLLKCSRRFRWMWAATKI